MNRRLALPAALAAAVLAAASLAGCDPKKVAGEDETPDGGDETPATVAPEAMAVGAVLAFHHDMIQAGLSQSAAYDTASASPAPGIRSFLGQDCVTVALDDSTGPYYEMTFDGCSDANGTTYAGRAYLQPTTTFDGYFISPGDDLGATNTANTELHHTFSEGNLTLTFVRNGSGVVTSVNVTNSLRHFILDEPKVTFAYIVEYTGGIGQHAVWPNSGGTVNVSWNGVGVFPVDLDAAGRGTFSMLGKSYQVDLDTGEVQFAST